MIFCTKIIPDNVHPSHLHQQESLKGGAAHGHSFEGEYKHQDTHFAQVRNRIFAPVSRLARPASLSSRKEDYLYTKYVITGGSSRERGGWGEVVRVNRFPISNMMSLIPTTGEREVAAKTRQNAADVLMSDAFREHAGGEKTTSRAASYGYKKVSDEGASPFVLYSFFLCSPE